MMTHNLMCLQHDDTQPHTVHHTVKQIEDLKLEVLPHLPYSLDLELGNFHLFCLLKDTMWMSLQVR